MSNRHKHLLTVFLLSVFLCLAFTNARAADTFSVTIPGGTEVVMQDSNSIIPVTVNNAVTSGSSIRAVTIRVNTASYTLSPATTAPTGWCINSLTVSTGTVVFRTLNPATGACSAVVSPGVQIDPGQSLPFNIIATPLQAVADVSIDTLLSVTIVTPNTFTQTGSIPSPAWTRRSFDTKMTAFPVSTATGGMITVNLQVTNMSSAIQNNITSLPAPPSASPAIASLSGGPFYHANLLNGAITALSGTVTVFSTTGFPATGTIQIDSEKIAYTAKTATTFTGLTRGSGGTTAASHVSASSVYDAVPFSLSASGVAGDSANVIWIYTATSIGNVAFSARAVDVTTTAQSLNETSNNVAIGDFTATLNITPASVVSGQTVTTTMTVQNNTSTALVNITPSALTAPPACLATETLVTGPTPTFIPSLVPGGSGIFTWTHTITGTKGQTYCLSGSASANGPISSTASTSNAGTISSYSATVSPTSVPSGTVNQTFTYTVYNGGSCNINRVTIDIPTQATCGATGFCYSGATAISPAGWTVSTSFGTAPDNVRFTRPGGGLYIPPGGSGTFTITFTTTDTVTADTYYNFAIQMREANTGGACSSTTTDRAAGVTVTVTSSSMTVTHSPAGVCPAAPVPADGSSTFTLTATLTSGGAPVDSAVIGFTTTNGTLSASSAVTNSSGVATVTLIAPYSTAVATASVTATYLNISKVDAMCFSAYAAANLLYWGNMAPNCVVNSSLSSFTMDVKNVSAVAFNPTSASYFAFNDGVNTYCAYLDAGSTGNIAAGVIKTLTFGSPTTAGAGGGVTVPAGFTAGSYLPMSNTTACPGLASGFYFYETAVSNQRRNVTDPVSVATRCGVDIIDWFEIR